MADLLSSTVEKVNELNKKKSGDIKIKNAEDFFCYFITFFDVRHYSRIANFFSKPINCQVLFAGVEQLENFEVKTRGINLGTSGSGVVPTNQ